MIIDETSSLVLRNARLFTGLRPISEIQDGEILVQGTKIVAVGSKVEAPPGARVKDCGGRLLTPALIDCHTHLVYAGNRANEFEMRLNGATYAEIAAAGGGIVASMRATRSATFETLVAQSLPRLRHLASEGVGTVEIKSGYGLDIASELTMLRAARALEKLVPVRIRTTWLAAHSVPPDYRGNADGYIRDVVIKGLDLAHAEGLVDAVDGFCEHLAFSVREIEQIFEHATALGLPVKLHAEQLSHQGGAALVARYRGLSADHLEWLTAHDAAALAEAGTVAVLLPGAFYMLRETRKPPVAALRQAGATMAIATDANPGTSPLTSLLLAMNMGAVLFDMTVGECLYGTTGAAAQALGIASKTGALRAGASADLCLWNVTSPAELVNPIGFNPLHERYFKGKLVA